MAGWVERLKRFLRGRSGTMEESQDKSERSAARSRINNPWRHRVAFGPGGSFAYRPGEVLVRADRRKDAAKILKALARERGAAKPKSAKPKVLKTLEPKKSKSSAHTAQSMMLNPDREHPDDEGEGTARPQVSVDDIKAACFVRFSRVPDPLEAVSRLNDEGIYAQPNHVVFAHTPPGVSGDGLSANPFYANPFYANPFYANPFYANPFYANPFYANPFYANPFYANPFYANPHRHLEAVFPRRTAPSSLARPTKKPGGEGTQPTKSPEVEDAGESKGDVLVAIFDTGYAKKDNHSPTKLPARFTEDTHFVDVPDPDGTRFYLDPVAGHGTFITGIVDQLAPGCEFAVYDAIEPFGDGDEWVIANMLLEFAAAINGPALVNLSFGGYSVAEMGALAEAVRVLHKGHSAIVASVGNDGVAIPQYPAALPHVVGVAALDHEGNAATFTNFGPWVRACALGVEVVSTFFKASLAHPEQAQSDIDDFEGWAVWSGTSFAAPRVVARLAKYLLDNPNNPDGSLTTPRQAVEALIDRPGLERRQQLGVVL